MSSDFQKFFGSKVDTETSIQTVKESQPKLKRSFRLSSLFNSNSKDPTLDEKLILRTAMRGLSLTLSLRTMKPILMANDLEVLFLCDTWSALSHEFEKAGFQIALSKEGTHDVMVVDVTKHSLEDIYPLTKASASIVLLGSIEILPSDRVMIVDEMGSSLRGVIYKSRDEEVQE